jgi:hypothetical protein
MQNVQLYIYVDDADGVPVAHRIELFNDEKISVTSSIQNFNDIGKLFTDYSQTFTIPASKHNNAIFRHWYESSVGDTNDINPQNVDNAFDHRIKYYGFIEINTIPFRDGKFTMQKANKKNGFIESYSINFVGNLVQLKDKFKEDKLNQLEGLDELNFEYNFANVINVTFAQADLKFPLIGSDRRYEYATGTVSDITTTTGAINYGELFPAVRVSKIFEYIQSRYGITFEGEFLNYDQFKQLFLYCKNTEKFNFYSNPLSPNFTVKNGTFTQMDLATETLTFSFQQEPLAFRYESWLKVTPTISTINYTVQIYDNGVLWNTFENLTGYQDLGYFSRYRVDENLVSGQFVTHVFTYKLTSEVPMTFDSELNLKANNGGLTGGYNRKAWAYADATSGDLQVSRYMPDMTVDTFVTAIVKAMNLVIVPIAEDRFLFQPMEAWYQEGDLRDITEFVEAEDIEISRPNLFKQITFKYEKSENVLNNAYRTLYNLDYGDLIFDNPDSAFTSNYDVKLPFENIMWERYTDTNFITATCWNKDLKAYTPKPILMYLNGTQSLAGGDPIYYTDGVIFDTSTEYFRFTNEIELGGSDLSYLRTLNWNAEISTWYLAQATNGLFQQYYANSIFNIYNQRTRVIKAKAHFNTYLLTSLKLNDKIALSNKRYTINSMTTDLTSGDVNLELLNDFRVIDGSPLLRYSDKTALSVDNTAQVVQFLIYKINYDTFDTVTSGGFLSYPITADNDADIVLNVTIPANTSGIERDDSIALQYYKNGVLTEIKIDVYQYA